MRTINLKKSATGAMALLGLAALALSQSATINDVFTQFKDINAKLIGNGKIRLVITGNPMKANFATQKMRMSAKRFEGIVTRPGKAPVAMLSATVTGGIHLEIDRASANSQSQKQQTMFIDTESATYDGAMSVVQAPGTITFRRSDAGTGETMNVKASSGEITLLQAGATGRARFGAKEMDFRGPVTMDMRGPVVEDGKAVLDDAGKPVFGTVKGRANRMTYNDAAGKLVLTGNVHIDGDHPLLFGKIDASKVEFTLDASGRVVEIDVVGEPAMTEITRRPPPRARSAAR